MTRLRRALACALVGTGAAALAYAGLTLAAAERQQEQLTRQAAAALRAAPVRGVATPPSALHGEGDVLGLIRIPAIGVRTAFFEGVGDDTLLAGPGHLPWTAPPGSADVSVLSAHRDLHFRDLHELADGDLVVLRLPGARVVYRVTGRSVVAPDDLTVTAPSGSPLLRLVTCWPPAFVGPAPDRLVVTAEPPRSPPAPPTSATRGPPARVIRLGSLDAPHDVAAGIGVAGAGLAAAATAAAASSVHRRRWFGPWTLGLAMLDASLLLLLG